MFLHDMQPWAPAADLLLRLSQLSLQPSRVAKSTTIFGWSKGGTVSSARVAITRLCDPTWHARLRVPATVTPGCITLAHRYTAFT